MQTRLLLLLFLLLIGLNPIKADLIFGTVSATNSIVGTNANDAVGAVNITELSNGNIVIQTPAWNGSRGAVTCLTRAEYTAGGVPISAANSLVGSTASDGVGTNVKFLSSGDYVVYSPNWDNFATLTTDVGAVTWVDGDTCIPYGETSRAVAVSATNSLIGSTAGDQVGTGVTILTGNNHYVVASPNWDNLVTANVGAVTWVNGLTGMAGVVSSGNSLTGATADDRVGNNDIDALTNGNYVVRSTNWDNGAVNSAGAVTWVNGTNGIPFSDISPGAVVGVNNSLVGSAASDQIGTGLTALSNGHYVVRSPLWDNGVSAGDAGAVTWGNGNGGTVGELSAANSLVGSTFNDLVGGNGITTLTGNNNYVVNAPNWDNNIGIVSDVGAVVWGNGTSGTSGVISPTNALIGSIASDQVGSGGITALTNGNYVVTSTGWDDALVVGDAGAVTWVNGATGMAFNETSVGAAVSASNSIIGSSGGDGASASVVALTSGNYVARFQNWDNVSPVITNTGAVMWGNGGGGTVGTISAINALIGTTIDDQIGSSGITPLTNGNYVVRSQNWDNTSPVVVNAGAVTWGDGFTGMSVGVISAANSLVGSSANDGVGTASITELTNGNYVVTVTGWDNFATGITGVGAVVWANGTSITAGAISSANASIGSTANDGSGLGITPLTNGNYVIRAPNWDNGTFTNAGAARWGDGDGGTVGPVDATNALVGGAANNIVSTTGVTALTNGNYVVRSRFWDNPDTGAIDAGAATWGNGNGGTVGVITSSNSLVGTLSNSLVSGANVAALSNGNYVVVSRTWDDGIFADVGAVTWGNGKSGTVGVVSSANSLLGSADTDNIGGDGIVVLNSGGFLIRSSLWDNAGISNAGAITYSEGAPDGVTVTESSGTTVSEAGTTDSFSVVLDGTPSTDVTLMLTFGSDLNVNGEADGDVSLTFTTLNWNASQMVTVAAANDSLVEGTQSANINFTVNSADGGYNSLILLPLNVVISDNDTAAVAFESAIGNAQETTTPYTVNAVLNLSTNPDGGSLESTVSVVVLDTPDTATAADYTLATTQIDFGAGATHGETDQIDVAIIDDAMDESDETFSLSFGTVAGEASTSGTHAVTIIDQEDVPTATPDPSTATSTPDASTPTFTPEPQAVELLVNNGFELRVNKPSQPDNWTPKKSTKDRLKCNTTTTFFARTGDCAYRFTGSTTERSQLSQPVTNVSGLSEGTILKASVYYKTNAATPKLKFKMVVFYIAAPLPDVTKETINTVSDSYILFALDDYLLESGSVEKIKFQFQNRAKSGKIYLDDASLSYTP